jgi:hypothetical protein
MMTKRWTVDIFIDERDSTTHAEARLYTNEATRLSGYGKAQRNPSDFEVPEIGDELAVGAAARFGLAGTGANPFTREPVSERDLLHRLLDQSAERSTAPETGDTRQRC